MTLCLPEKRLWQALKQSAEPALCSPPARQSSARHPSADRSKLFRRDSALHRAAGLRLARMSWQEVVREVINHARCSRWIGSTRRAPARPRSRLHSAPRAPARPSPNRSTAAATMRRRQAILADQEHARRYTTASTWRGVYPPVARSRLPFRSVEKSILHWRQMVICARSPLRCRVSARRRRSLQFIYKARPCRAGAERMLILPVYDFTSWVPGRCGSTAFNSIAQHTAELDLEVILRPDGVRPPARNRRSRCRCSSM